MKRRLQIAALAGGVLLVAALVSPAAAQEGDLEAAIGRTQSGAAATREAQVQVAAQPPNTADRQELAIFYHKRGMANHLLGNYARAVADLRLALEHNQPGRPAPNGWGERWRIQNALGSAHRERGDWKTDIDLWIGVAAEYQKSNLFNYHYAQLRLMDAYMVLAQWAEGEKARQEAEAVLPRLRSLPGWAARGFNVEDQHNHYMGIMFGVQGNHREAERRFRLSLAAAEKNLESRRSSQPETHQTVRVALSNLGTARRRLAENLSTQGRYGEAELLARSALEDTLALNAFNTIAVGRGLAAIGWARFQQGDVAGAENYYRHALSAIEGSGTAAHSTRLAGRRADLALTQLVQEQWDGALNMFAERDRGLRSDKAQFERTGSRHVSWAYALHKAGQHERAAEMAARLAANQLKRPVPDRWGLAQRRGVLAMALAASGSTSQALQSYRESIPDLLRRDQDDADESIGYFRVFWQRAILEGYLDLLAKLHASGDGPGGLDLADESFRIADIARGSAVQEAISATAARAQLPDRNLSELARREQDTLNRIAALNQLLAPGSPRRPTRNG